MGFCCAVCKHFEPTGHLNGFCRLNRVKISDSTNPKEACSLGEKVELPSLMDPTKILSIDIKAIKSSEFVMRKLDKKIVSDLVISVKQHGLLQPIMVRPTELGYEVVFGRHRLEACKILGWKTIPAVIRELTDDNAIFLQITENIQRNIKMGPVKEGAFYAQLQRKGWSTYRIGRKIGRSAVYVQDRISIAQKLHPELRPLIEESKLSASMAHRIAELPHKQQIKIANKAVNEKWRIRDFELNVRGRKLIQCHCLQCPIHGAIIQNKRPKPPENELYLAGTWIKVRSNISTNYQRKCVFCSHIFEQNEYVFPLKWKGNLTSHESCQECALARAPPSFQYLFGGLSKIENRSLGKISRGEPILTEPAQVKVKKLLGAT